MRRNKSSLSEAQSYKEMGEFWANHDLTDYWDQTKAVEFEVEIESEATYFPVETNLSAELVSLAKRRGVSPETLLNLWIQEKVKEEAAAE
ncbi:MAG: BrnA antitoxin family protein [Acidobacteria bacterium]|nr:BrnA antitoxin family protein [Acidobacteriota bacterium]